MIYSPSTIQVRSARGQSHPLLAPLIAAVFALVLLLVPVIHSATTSSPNIPLFDPSNFTAEQLATSTLHDGIPDVWKTWYNLSVRDTTVANADYTDTGIMNAEKYQLNIYPLAPADSPPPATPPKVTAKAATPVAKAATNTTGSLLKGGDFEDQKVSLPHTFKNGYKGKDFQWGQGPVAGWKAVTGKNIEVWHTEADGKQFVELNANKTNYGIEQGIKIDQFHEGTYLLAWKQMGREAAKVLTDGSHYTVHVFAKTVDEDQSNPTSGDLTKDGQELLLLPLKDYAGAKDWTLEAVTFNLNTDDLKKYKKIWIAFVPKNPALTYGALIDNIVLSPVEIVAVFGFGALQGKDRLDGVLAARAQWSIVGAEKSLFLINGKPPHSQSGEKLWVVQTGKDEATLKSALKYANYVSFDGHSNFGVGPAFNPLSIRKLSDFMNLGNLHAGIDWGYLNQTTEYPNLETIPDAQIAGNPDPKNYIVFPLRVNKLRYLNENHVGPGARFSLQELHGIKYHYTRRANPQGSEWEQYTIVQAGKADMPSNLGYQSFFYNACDSARDYSEVFTTGNFFCSNTGIGVNNEGTDAYVEAIIDGKTNKKILEAINDSEAPDPTSGEPAFRLVN